MKKKNYLFLFVIFSFFIFSCQSINTEKDILGTPKYTVIFSFDDGPDENTTPLLLDVLAKYQIKAFFCLLGVNAEKYPGIVRRIYDEGHLFINHGYHDKWAVHMNNEEFRDNLIKCEEAVTNALGFYPHPKFFRPHGGFYKSFHRDIITDEGYILLPVNIRAYDAVSSASGKAATEREIINKTIKRNGGVILLHDARGGYQEKEEELKRNPLGPFNRSWIPETVENIIISLLDKGYILSNIDILEILGIESGKPE